MNKIYVEDGYQLVAAFAKTLLDNSFSSFFQCIVAVQKSANVVSQHVKEDVKVLLRGGHGVDLLLIGNDSDRLYAAFRLIDLKKGVWRCALLDSWNDDFNPPDPFSDEVVGFMKEAIGDNLFERDNS